MSKSKIDGHTVNVWNFNTVIIGAGAAGMNCAVHLYEFMEQKGITKPEKRIAVVTGGLKLGTSRMSGSDKQTYYKMGTSPDVPDTAESFAESLTGAGCCHSDLALAEAIGSLREFYHLVQSGVPFPHDSMGAYIGYKTDHDPYERATSAGPKTSKYMSECLEKKVRDYGIRIFDAQEVAELLVEQNGTEKRITGVLCLDKKKLSRSDLAVNVFHCNNMVLAAGGPGELYKTSVYPKGQVGIHGLAFKAGLEAENLTESQFGLASIKFRWNVSGTYMQVVPRIFSTNSKGGDENEFLTSFFPSMSKMATAVFLKGYQWPFDPQKIVDYGSSLIDVLVFNETQKGRRVFMDFQKNPVPKEQMKEFCIEDLEPQARDYLQDAGAFQGKPIERLEHMNPPAIDIYSENGIDLHTEPLEIAVCAQHNNGGFAVDKWWQTNIAGTFVIGEMAGTHGVKRPGGSALNAGQVGGLRAAQYIVNAGSCEIVDSRSEAKTENNITALINQFVAKSDSEKGLIPDEVLKEIKERMTAAGGHLREIRSVKKALREAVELYRKVDKEGFKIENPNDIIKAVQAGHLSLSSVGYLKAITELLIQGSGSRGSHLVLSDEGIEVHSEVKDSRGKTLKFKPENTQMKNSVLRVRFDKSKPDMFHCQSVPLREAPKERNSFERAWQEYRENRIYDN